MYIYLMNKLFGWHYIRFQFGFDDTIRRVKKQPNGVKCVTAYGISWEVMPDGRLVAMASGHDTRYTPLTWRLDNENKITN